MMDDAPRPAGDKASRGAAPAARAPARRRLLKQMAIVAGLVAAYPAWRHFSPSPPQAVWRTEPPWATLDAVLAHLFPAAPDAPGAVDIHALDYLYNALGHADGESRDFIVQGAGWLDDLTQTDAHRPFVMLDEAAREAALRKIEASDAGSRWLSLLLTYLLEALLADPVYGGNAGGAGWAWLEHRPGFPTPTPDKVWWRLGNPVRVRHKAA